MNPVRLRSQFDAGGEAIMTEMRRRELKDCVVSLESLDDTGKLMRFTVADK